MSSSLGHPTVGGQEVSTGPSGGTKPLIYTVGREVEGPDDASLVLGPGVSGHPNLRLPAFWSGLVPVCSAEGTGQSVPSEHSAEPLCASVSLPALLRVFPTQRGFQDPAALEQDPVSMGRPHLTVWVACQTQCPEPHKQQISGPGAHVLEMGDRKRKRLQEILWLRNDSQVRPTYIHCGVNPR